MKLFHIKDRQNKKVAEAVRFTDGRCAVNWLTKKPGNKNTTLSFYDNIEHIIDIHGYNNVITIEFLKGEEKPETKIIKEEACYTEDPNNMCKQCDCWKLTRLYCS